jgi:hypothetical protein
MMKRNAFTRWASAVAALGMALPSSLMAATPIAATPAVATPVVEAPADAAVTDIALRPGGVLVGQVVDPQGVATAGTPVTIEFAGKEVARTTTDEHGVFAAQGLRGGQYKITTIEGSNECRLWAPETAPPSARPAALVVKGKDLVRGVPGGGVFQSWKEWCMAHPYITAGTVATAVAVPIIIADDDWDSGS